MEAQRALCNYRSYTFLFLPPQPPSLPLDDDDDDDGLWLPANNH